MCLRPSGYSRFNKMAHHIFINQPRISFRMSQHMRARTYYRHFTFKDINKLWKFIKIRASKKISKASFPGIINCCLFIIRFFIHSHRTEFIAFKINTIQTSAHLLKNDRTGGSHFYDNSHDQVNKWEYSN